jgi:hypothetical protein
VVLAGGKHQDIVVFLSNTVVKPVLFLFQFFSSSLSAKEVAFFARVI